jgi:hypothetical protein
MRWNLNLLAAHLCFVSMEGYWAGRSFTAISRTEDTGRPFSCTLLVTQVVSGQGSFRWPIISHVQEQAAMGANQCWCSSVKQGPPCKVKHTVCQENADGNWAPCLCHIGSVQLWHFGCCHVHMRAWHFGCCHVHMRASKELPCAQGSHTGAATGNSGSGLIAAYICTFGIVVGARYVRLTTAVCKQDEEAVNC